MNFNGIYFSLISNAMLLCKATKTTYIQVLLLHGLVQAVDLLLNCGLPSAVSHLIYLERQIPTHLHSMYLKQSVIIV